MKIRYSDSMDKDQEIEQLKAALQEALQMIAVLRQQVQDLEARRSKDSHNSHLPPSSDRFARQPKSLRKKSEKPTGGQKGHPGHHLRMVEAPDHMVVRTPGSCAHCQQDLRGEPIDHVVRRQVFEVPMPRLHVTEYQLQSKCCPHCQALTLAPCPTNVNA